MFTKQRPRIRTFDTKLAAEEVAQYRRKAWNEETEIRPSTYAGRPAFKLVSYTAA